MYVPSLNVRVAKALKKLCVCAGFTEHMLLPCMRLVPKMSEIGIGSFVLLQSGPEVIKLFFKLNSIEHGLFSVHKCLMSIIVGILTCINRIKNII